MLNISVIIPVRNEADHIGEVLDRLLEQNYEAFEILVVDGMSDDATPDIVRSYMEKSDRIRLFQNPRRLSSAARNIGVQNARGDAVLIVDGHCLIEDRDMLQNVNRAFESTQADCLGRPQPLEMQNASTLQWAIATARRSPLGHHPESFIYSGQAQFAPAASVAIAYRKEVFAQVGLFDESFDACEDGDLNHRIDLAGLRCYFEPAIAVHYVPRKTLQGLCYQMYRYGRGRVRLWRKHPDTFSFKGFAPGIFLFCLTLGLPFCFLEPAILCLYCGVLTLYGLVILGESARLATLSRRLSLLPLLPLVFAVIHFGFGLGIVREMGQRRP